MAWSVTCTFMQVGKRKKTYHFLTLWVSHYWTTQWECLTESPTSNFKPHLDPGRTGGVGRGISVLPYLESSVGRALGDRKLGKEECVYIVIMISIYFEIDMTFWSSKHWKKKSLIRRFSCLYYQKEFNSRIFEKRMCFSSNPRVVNIFQPSSEVFWGNCC